MTIPWQMNCGHSEDSWCLDCVSELGEKWSALKDQNKIMLDELAVLRTERDALREALGQLVDYYYAAVNCAYDLGHLEADEFRDALDAYKDARAALDTNKEEP